MPSTDSSMGTPCSFFVFFVSHPTIVRLTLTSGWQAHSHLDLARSSSPSPSDGEVSLPLVGYLNLIIDPPLWSIAERRREEGGGRRRERGEKTEKKEEIFKINKII